MNRQPGYYWCKYNGEWTVAKWNGFWFRTGVWKIDQDSDFEEIDERRIERTDRAILPKEDYNPIPDNPSRYISDNPYLCTPDIDKNPEWT